MSSTPNLFQEAAVPGKGQGLVALVPIKRGQLILAEEPLFQLLILPPSVALNDMLRDELHNLTHDDQQKYFGLSNSFTNTNAANMNAVSGVWWTNHMITDDNVTNENIAEKKIGMAGMFLVGSRVNHSCTPNAESRWFANMGKMLFFAIKDINVGEEINICYCETDSWALSRQNRRAALQQNMQFACICSVCSLPANAVAASDARREKFSVYHQALPGMIEKEKGYDGKALLYVKEMLEILEEEEESGGKVVDVYKSAIKVCLKNSDHAHAQAFGELALKEIFECHSFIEDKEALRKRFGEDTAEECCEIVEKSSCTWSSKASKCLAMDDAGFEKWLWKFAG